MLQDQQQDPLHLWVSRIKYRNIPVFSQTVQEIAQLTASDRSSAFDLAHVILRDASLTARVLRAANSHTLNPNQYPINGVSRAVIMLGFNTVRRISLSVALIDAFLCGGHRERVLEELARSFHAATQAWSFARHCGDRDPEEIFVATLLHSIGEIAFWMSNDTLTFDLDVALRQGGAHREETEERVLGFRLRDLTARLVREWRVSGLLDSSIDDASDTDARARYVRMGHAIAMCAERGWSESERKQISESIEGMLKLQPATVAAMMSESARDAARMAMSYDVPQLGALIPQTE